MSYYLDEDASPKMAEIARGRCGLEVVSAHAVGTHEWPDDRQLAYAASDDCCLVTRNQDDFMTETLNAFEAGTPHAGVLVIPRSLPNDRFTAIAAALCDHAERHPEGLAPYTIDFL